MRLLNSRDQTFGSFDGEAVPPYAILSHTWGDGEVTHQDMVAWIYERKGSRSFREKKGFLKIDLTCKQADHDGLDWVWIDTCNIDKTSSSELSEAINSMFQWYKNAAICYVYLEDISCDDLVSSEGTTRLMPEVLRSARWFSRGWTLQELLASEKMNLFCAVPGHSQWSFIGSKDSVSMYLATITGIDRAVLEEPDLLPTVSVARRMSWAARRETTRPEDIAYCLLGVFQVNMPLLYGEGANAFIRLQEEIIKTSEDESLFAWTPKPSLISNSQVNDGILASHPKAFSESSEIVPYASKLAPYNMTNRGLHIESRIVPLFSSNSSYRQAISCLLHCRYESSFESSICIELETDTVTGRYRRCRYGFLGTIRHDVAKSAHTKSIYIHKYGPFRTRPVRHCHLRAFPESEGFHFEAAIALSIEYDSFLRGPVLDVSSVYAPGKEKIPWDLKHRALIAHTTEYGYFSALSFSRKNTSREYGHNCGFIALLILPNKVDVSERGPLSGVFLTPLMKTPNQSELHLPLESGFKRIESCEHTLDLGYGKVTAQLTKEHQFGDDTFALDITFHPEHQSDIVLHFLPQPEIRVFDPENCDVTVPGYGSLVGD